MSAARLMLPRVIETVRATQAGEQLEVDVMQCILGRNEVAHRWRTAVGCYSVPGVAN